MCFWCLQFPPKNERKQVDLRFHSNKVEFVRSFFRGNIYLKKSFRLFPTFSCRLCFIALSSDLIISSLPLITFIIHIPASQERPVLCWLSKSLMNESCTLQISQIDYIYITYMYVIYS